MESRTCPTCNGPIVGRKDKKYCSDFCRYHAKNLQRTDAEPLIYAMNQILRKNRNILKSLCPQGKATVRRTVLRQRGYDFNQFTSLFVTQSRQAYYLCYDFGFTPLVEHGVEKALIINRQPYMKNWDPWRKKNHGDSSPSVES